MPSEHGQATIEWVGIVSILAVGLAALAALAPVVDGRSFGGFLAGRIVCAVRGAACPARAEQSDLVAAYGPLDAELVRRYAPGMVYEPGEREVPVDFRACREVACATTPNDRDLDVHTTDAGRAVTQFTRVVHRSGTTYIQYWFYYPDSNTRWASSDKIWDAGRVLAGHPRARYPGFHEDDWEGYEVRVGADGAVDARATSHGGLQWCKWAECKGVFGPATGWTRVSAGSHSGHVPLERRVRGALGGSAGKGVVVSGRIRIDYRRQLPGVNLRERTSTADEIRLVPLEILDTSRYRRKGSGVSPPWEKALYRDPAGNGS